MKPSHAAPHQPYILQSNVKCLNVCCPASNPHHPPPSPPFQKKAQKFINLTLNKPKSPQPVIVTLVNEFVQRSESEESVVVQKSFQDDKSSFLMQIRKYNPNPQFSKQEQIDKHTKSLDTTKEIELSRKTNASNNLSALLQNMSNEIFSEMFVSSSVRGKINLSSSLGSISEVKSEMQASQPTDSIINHLQYTQQR